MATTDRTNQWRPSQFAVRRRADAAVSQPRRYAVLRDIAHADGRTEAAYAVQQSPTRLSADAFQAWREAEGLAGDHNLDLALLVIRETRDHAGNIAQCVIERRRGSPIGPFRGEPARIEFRGSAGDVRLFSAEPDGTLRPATAPPALAAPTARRRGRKHALGYRGEEAALRAHFGSDVTVVERRSPTLGEEMVGLSTVVHVRITDQTLESRTIGCGIGWFGPLAFILTADFPRLGQIAEFAPEIEFAIEAILHKDDLVRHETRVDQDGPCVIACHRNRRDLFVIRPSDGSVTAQPYALGRKPHGSDDQRRWIRYVEAHEGLVTLDTYLTADPDILVVLTGDDQGQVWHHNIDPDGVEVGCGPANETAAALLYRLRLSSRTT